MKNRTITIASIYIALIIVLSAAIILTSFYSYFYSNREFKTSNLTFVADTKVVTDDMYSIDVKVNDKCDYYYSEYKIDYVLEEDLMIAYVFIYGTYMDQEACEDGVFNLKVPIGDADKITFYGNGTKKTLWVKGK